MTDMTMASADPAARSSPFQTLGIGIWVGMVCWAAPTARLTMTSETVTVEPYWPAAKWLTPTYEFGWSTFVTSSSSTGCSVGYGVCSSC